MSTTLPEKLVTAKFTTYNFDSFINSQVYDIFTDYVDAGVIVKGTRFDDPVWPTTDEYANIGLHFDFNVFEYNSFRNLFKMDLSTFVKYVKGYCLTMLGDYVLTTIQNFVYDARRMIKYGLPSITDTHEDLFLACPWILSDFICLTAEECEEKDQILTTIDVIQERILSFDHNRQRTLSEFDSYFRFDEIMDRFWAEEFDPDTRLFYTPLYLWWKITVVIPCRPKEFILTPRDCLKIDDKGRCFFTMRHLLTKGFKREKTYSISGDTRDEVWEIPVSLANVIKQYLESTADCRQTTIETLFVTAPHFRKWKSSAPSNSRFYTYSYLYTALKYFYTEIIDEKYGMDICREHEERYLEENEIGFIHLGDTRHIALINLLQEGGTTVQAMILAGHANDEMAAHYYSNVEKLIQCQTHRLYRRLTASSGQFAVSNYKRLPDVADGIQLADGSFCYSRNFAEGRYTDCVDALGESGELGHCPSCPFCRGRNVSHFSAEDIYRNNLKTDFYALTDVVERIRNEKGDAEELGRALLRLQSSSLSYQQYLMEKETN